MKDELKQRGRTILSSDDGISIPVIYNNLAGVNMKGDEYKKYLKYIAVDDMGFQSGKVEFFRNGKLYKSCTIPDV